MFFISKRKFYETIDEAVAKERERSWKREDDRTLRMELDEIRKRLYELEKRTGIVEEPKCCCCRNNEEVVPKTSIGY